MKAFNCKINSIDAFVDDYEYFTGMYSLDPCKGCVELYPHQEVSELLTHITIVWKTEVSKVKYSARGSVSFFF